jgi:hypothetical protein
MTNRNIRSSRFNKTANFVKTIFKNFLFAVLLFFGLAQSARAAVGLTISPNTVSNTYNGKITLTITGISSGGTVVIQKFADLNTNGVIDAADYMLQQFSLTDAAASVFHDGSTAVTNFNVPVDTDTTAGQITAAVNFQNGDFSQNLVGRYLYKVYSSSGTVTNSLMVTNFPFAQSFTGNVFSNSTATVVSNAIILLFQPSSNGNLNPKAGTVANNSGNYTIKVPPGNYLLVAIRSNYLANTMTAPLLTLGSGSTITTNLTLTNATQSISGAIVDSTNPALGIPGFLVPAESTTNGFLGVGFADTNGNFTIGTRPDQWKLSSDDNGLVVHGYLALQNSIKTNTAGGSVTKITNALPKATAIFYGSVKDNLGNPLFGIYISSSDDMGQYETEAFTDANGNYVAGASGTNWNVNVSTDSNPTNYVFSQGFDTALTNGQAQQVDFTAILATNHITGYVKDNNGNPIVGVGISANATINSVPYQTQVDTDTNGNYLLNVPNGTWDVSVNCNGGNDSLNNLGSYACPSDQNVTNNNNNQVANFTVQICSGISITTASPLPVGEIGVYYNQFLQASSCNGNFNWLQTGGSLPGLSLFSSGELNGLPNSSGVFTFTAQVTDQSSLTTNQQFSLSISNAVQISTTSLPGSTNGLFYSQQLQAAAGVPFGGGSPYNWSLASGNLPANLNLAANGLISGTIATNGAFNFTAQVTDSLGGTFSQPLSLFITDTNLPPLSVGTSGGQIIVLWPASAGTNFTLQTTTNLATGPWVTASNGVPQVSFTFSNTAPAVFFRLR